MILRLGGALVLFLILLAAGLFGGGETAFDQSVVISLARWRTGHPDWTEVVILLTYLGGSPVLLVLAAVAAIATARRNRKAAIALVVTVLGGRLLLELTKLAVNRPRPAFDAHPVNVFSQSFPSGHAANSLMTYGAIVLFVLPERWRARGLAAAMLLSLAIGATRPVLGVHWPSDVIGGWCLGALWLLACSSVWQRTKQSA